MRRLTSYIPLRPAYDPVSRATKTTFTACEGIEDYDIFEDKGEVLIFRREMFQGKYKKTNCLKCMSHGVGVIEDCADLHEEYSRKLPRPEK